MNGGRMQCTGEVIDIPQTPVQVTQHRWVARTCSTCHKRRVLVIIQEHKASGNHGHPATLITGV